MKRKYTKRKIDLPVDRSVRLDGRDRGCLEFGETEFPFTSSDMQDELNHTESYRTFQRERFGENAHLTSDEN